MNKIKIAKTPVTICHFLLITKGFSQVKTSV